MVLGPLVDAVGLGLRLAVEYRVLTTSAGAENVLTAHGGVVDESRLLDFVIGALASLVVGREAPGVDLAILGDCKAVVGTCSNGADVGSSCESS